MADLNVAVRIVGEDAGASKIIGGVIEKMGSLGKAAAIGAAAIGGTFAAGLAKGVQSAGDLEQAVANISTIKPEIDTSAVFGALNEMSTRVPQSASQLGDSLYNVFSSIETTQTGALQLVEQFAKGAVGAQTDAQTFGTAVLGVMNAYGLAVEDAAHISDVFFNTVKTGVVTGQELAYNLGPVTQSAKAAGVELDVLGGLLAGVTKEGGPAAQNINNLNNFLQKVTTKDAQREINALGVATKDQAGNFRPVLDVLSDLKPRLEGMTESARANALQAIFPDAQARVGAQTILSQLDTVKAAVDENRASTGSAASAYEKMSATFNSQTQLLGNTLTSMLTMVGAEVLPSITPLVTTFAQNLPSAFQTTRDLLGPMVETLGTLATQARDGLGSALQWVQDRLADLGPALAGFSASTGPLGAAIGEALSGMTGAAQALAQVLQGDLAGAFSTAEGAGGNFGRMVQQLTAWLAEHRDVIAGVVAGFVALQVISGVTALVGTITAAVGTFTAALAASGSVIGAIVALLGGPVTIAIAAVVVAVGLLTAAWVGNWGDIQGNTAAVVDFLSTVPGTVGAFFDEIGTHAQTLVDGITRAWITIQTTTQTTFLTVQQFLTTTLAGLGEAWSAGWTAMSTAVGGAWTTIVGSIRGGVNEAIGFINRLISAWNALEFRIPGFSVELPSADVPGVGKVGGGSLGWGGVTVSTPDLPLIAALAAGGIVTRPTLALVGEAGPEAVIPLSRGGYAPQTARMSSAEMRELAGYIAQAMHQVHLSVAVDDIISGLNRRQRNGGQVLLA